MTIKTLLLILFLYVCLAWVGAVLLTPEDILRHGLFWTAIGLIVMLALVIGSRLFGWWRVWRAKAASRPAAPVKSAPIQHEDDAALAAFIAEANANLKKSPAFAGKLVASPLAGMPLFLLVGPEGSGKTSTFMNSGLEPQLLAGQGAGTGSAMPTRLCNIWLANDAIFVELSGRAFSGDPGRWTQLLRVLRGNNSSASTWQRLWRPPAEGLALRAVIAFCEAKDFTGTPSSQALDRRSRDLQERLQAIGDVFEADFPVYQVFSKSDAIPYFTDFFRRIPENDANQVFGCTLPRTAGAAGSTPDEAAKQLTRTFRPLYQEIAKRRITQLAHEPDPSRRPAVYEFPRELKRIRTPLLQFLTDTFRSHPLRLGPALRGYYLTGVREIEVAAAALTETRADWGPQKMEATRLFSAADATRIFRPGDAGAGLKVAAGNRLVQRWTFTNDLFRGVILADRPMRSARPVDKQADTLRNAILAGVCGVCLLFCIAFLWSFTGNQALLRNIKQVAESGFDQQGKPLQEKLGNLDLLREQLQHLIDWDHSKPWGLSWGLYEGGRVLPDARQAYFTKFRGLLLAGLNGEIVKRLRPLPPMPPEGAPYDPVYQQLQTHLMISGTCAPVDSVVTNVLESVRGDIGLAAGSSAEQTLANKQIEFYARELPDEKLWRISLDNDAASPAQKYLQNSKGIDRLYRSMLSQVESGMPKQSSLDQLPPNYTKVLTGPAPPSIAFTPEGWKLFEKLSKTGVGATSGDACILGSGTGGDGQPKDAGTARSLQMRYIQDYIARWRDFLRGFSVRPYGGAEDAATKLGVLSDFKSPLLALFFLTGAQTNFPATVETASQAEKVVEKVGLGGLLSGRKKAEKAAQSVGLTPTPGRELSPADITRVFQPVVAVVPLGDKMVSDVNRGYLQALRDLGQAMQAIASNPSDQGTQQAAQEAYKKASGAASQIEDGFRVVGADGVDTAVASLLERPITNAKGLIHTNLVGEGAGETNKQLRPICAGLSIILRKYPFQASSKEDIGLDELQKWFGPGSPIWKFQQTSLADLTMKDGSQWKAKDPAKKPQVTDEMLAFLTRAQAIADAFYPGGSAQPLTYSLRPKLDSTLKEWKVTLTIDGETAEWTPTSSLQKQFRWPARSPGDQGAAGRIEVGGFSTSFASQGGPWGLFRIMRDAQPRPMMQKAVEWRFTHTADGRSEPLKPPVTLEIASFPGGVDVFNPKFFEGIQCPTKAVQ